MKGLFVAFKLWVVLLLSFPSNGEAVIPILRTITVDIQGYGTFPTIQAAIDSIPVGNKQRTQINIKSGIYNEKVNLIAGKGLIVFQGDGPLQTRIEWGDYSPIPLSHIAAQIPSSKNKLGNFSSHSKLENLRDSATLTISANNVVFMGIAFVNTYSESLTKAVRAIAALIEGDQVSFYDCSFIGVQDTLYDYLGRHYFKNCYIEGAVDFVFGYAQSLYESCTLNTVPSLATAGWVTANGRSNAFDPTGFVFRNCVLTGQAPTYLGRAWGSYSRVIFYKTDMSNIVVPAGWDYWSDPDQGLYTTYAESGCTGAGSDNLNRVGWEKTLSDQVLEAFTSISFVDDGWLGQQGGKCDKAASSLLLVVVLVVAVSVLVHV